MKDFREAYDRTIEEAEEEIANIEAAIRDETLIAINQRIRHIERLPNFATDSVEFKQPLTLSGPAEITDDKPVAVE